MTTTYTMKVTGVSSEFPGRIGLESSFMVDMGGGHLTRKTVAQVLQVKRKDVWKALIDQKIIVGDLLSVTVADLPRGSELIAFEKGG